MGALITLLAALGAGGLGNLLFGRWTLDQDPAARLGLHGLLGLGFLGWITLPIGLLPTGFQWGVGVVGILVLAGLLWFLKEWPRGALPKRLAALALLPIMLGAGVALVGVLAPSDTYDWDSLAYHLAVPKLWLAAGRIEFVSYIHHSNFPFLVDNLFVWGELWGGQSGAKAFMLAYAVYGLFAVFGLARARYGDGAGWWSAVAFGTAPLVVWESGTAYVDVAHALFGGLGIWLAAGLVEETEGASWVAESPFRSRLRDPRWILPAFLLGGAVGSKYTALQTLSILGAVLLVYALVKRPVPKGEMDSGGSLPSPLPLSPGGERGLNALAIVKMGLVALAIGSPWYVKNVVTTGNPVYPFFFSKLGGKNWDAFQETIYKDQQQTFGAGRPISANYTAGPLEPARLGSSVLGTAYMPGRYSDPAPTGGQGFPFVSLGAIPLAAMLAWLVSGRASRREGACLAVALVSFGAWFFLSQQARYSLVWCVPLFLMAGGAVARLRVGRVVAGAVALQAALTLFVATRFNDAESRFASKLRVVLGTETPEAYLRATTGFADPARFLNETPEVKRVALFDEVFGYLLDKPYFWATPGHTTEMGYASMRSGGDLVAALERLRISHVYIALGTTFGGNEEEAGKWLLASGLDGPATPYKDRAARMGDPRNAVKVLLAEAIASGRLRPIQSFGSRPSRARIVFEVRGR